MVVDGVKVDEVIKKEVKVVEERKKGKAKVNELHHNGKSYSRSNIINIDTDTQQPNKSRSGQVRC